MSDSEALKIFARQPVSESMIDLLVSTTSSVIQVKPLKKSFDQVGDLLVAPVQVAPLKNFIYGLVKYSNVQTPTLMASLVYLNRLRNVLPGNAVGMESTRHRIFLAALILSAKSLNDSSPLNKHWTKYTDGLLTNQEINLAERELIGLLRWNLTLTERELVVVLQPFLGSIKQDLKQKRDAEAIAKSDYYRLSSMLTKSNQSIASYESSRSVNSALSLRKLYSSQYSLGGQLTPRTPLREQSPMTGNALCYKASAHSKGAPYLSVPRAASKQYICPA